MGEQPSKTTERAGENIMNFGDLIAAGGFWGAMTVLYHMGADTIAAAIGDATLVTEVINVWIQRKLARAYRIAVVLTIVEMLLAFFTGKFFHEQFISPLTGPNAMHFGINDRVWQMVLIKYIPLVGIALLIVTLAVLWVKPIKLGAILESIVWEANGSNQDDVPVEYLNHDERTSQTGRFNTVTVLAPIVIPIVCIASISTEFLVFGDLLHIGWPYYFIGAFVLCLLMFIHAVLTRKIAIEISTVALGGLTEFVISFSDEIVRFGIASSIPGYTKADLDAKFDPIKAPIVAGIRVVADRWYSIEIAIWLFYMMTAGMYAHQGFMVALIVTALGFFVAVGIEPAYNKVGLTYDSQKKFGIRAMMGGTLVMIAFQIFVELGAGHITPRPTVFYYLGKTIHLLDLLVHNPLTWILLVVGGGLALYKKGADMPKWVRNGVIIVVSLCGLVALAALVNQDFSVSDVVRIDAGRHTVLPNPQAVPELTLNSFRRTDAGVSSSAPPPPARSRRSGRTVSNADQNVSPCPSGPGVDDAFIATMRRDGLCQ